jgi:dolichol-phosphate mannosyltransferase
MSGFFMLRREVIDGADLRPTGYKILLEILMEGHFQKVAEVPYTFRVRERGESKLSARQQIDYLEHLYSLMRRTGELVRFLKFIGVGLSGIAVSQGVLTLVTLFTNWNKNIAVIPGIEVSIISNFLLNDYFTFADRRTGKRKSFIGRILKFNLVCLAGAGINLGIYSLILGLSGVDNLAIRLIANLIGIIIAFVWNYILSLVWTWR